MKLRLTPVFALSLILTACGGGDSAIEGARDIPNRFGTTTNALDDFNAGSTGDSSNTAGLQANEVRVTMEVPASYAPNGEPTRRNLRVVIPDQVRVYRSNPSLQNLGNLEHSTGTGDDGHVVIGFPGGLPIGPDVIIEATYSGGGKTLTMKALAADSDRDVKVNPFSHYLVERGLGGYSSGEFQTVMDCVTDQGGALCLNKYVWSSLADQVHDFEIDVASTANLSQTLSDLEGRVDFAGYVQRMADYARLGPNVSGSIRASSADYHSVFLGLELGQTFRDDRYPGSGQWGVRTAQEEDLGGGAYLYPALTLTSFEAFNINVTSLATDIPYDRETLMHSFTDLDGEQFFSETDWARNSHSSSPGAATLTPPSADGTDPARLLAGRSLYQSVTDRDTSNITGWTRNPYYLDAFSSAPGDAQSGPDRVMGSYFSAGKAIALADEGGKLKREDTLEDHYLSVFELHLLRSADFDLAKVANNEYNLVYLAAQFGGSNPVAFESGFGPWVTGSVAGDVLAGDLSLASFAITRAAGSSAPAASGPHTVNETWNLANRPSVSGVSNDSRYLGRLSLCETCPGDPFAQPDLGLGAATPDGSLLAFNLDDSYLGDGLVIAGKTPSVLAPVAGNYRVQGALVAMTAETNALYQVTNGVLVITSDGGATLSADNYQVIHTITENRVSEPAPSPMAQDFAVTSDASGRIDMTGGELVLNGFYTGAADQMFLVVQDNTGPELRTGLLIATLIPEHTANNP